jgi:hypothetical protein
MNPISNPQEIRLNKAELLKQLKGLPVMAKERGWQFDYDQTLDSLTFGEETMPRNSFLFNVNDEINLFVDSNSKIHGMFVEYFGSNYVEHNEVVKDAFSVVEDSLSAPVEDSVKFNLARLAIEGSLVSGALASIASRSSLITAI